MKQKKPISRKFDDSIENIQEFFNTSLDLEDKKVKFCMYQMNHRITQLLLLLILHTKKRVQMYVEIAGR